MARCRPTSDSRRAIAAGVAARRSQRQRPTVRVAVRRSRARWCGICGLLDLSMPGDQDALRQPPAAACPRPCVHQRRQGADRRAAGQVGGLAGPPVAQLAEDVSRSPGQFATAVEGLSGSEGETPRSAVGQGPLPGVPQGRAVPKPAKARAPALGDHPRSAQHPVAFGTRRGIARARPGHLARRRGDLQAQSGGRRRARAGQRRAARRRLGRHPVHASYQTAGRA